MTPGGREALRAAAGTAEALLRPAGVVSSAVRHQPAVLRELDHRPWPLPDRPWVMGQSWRNLAFLHWPADTDRLAAVMPPQLPPDTYEGQAWLGVTPFLVEGLRARGMAPIPGISRFLEVNVRTYVTVGGKPGIFFFSLDAASRLAVAAARRFYRLPYFHARMAMDGAARGQDLRFRSARASADGPPAQLDCDYRPAGRSFQAQPGSLEHWLTERYCLYTLDERKRVHRGDIHHPPWPLQPGRATIRANTMAEPYGLRPAGEPLVHFCERQDVVFWPIQPSP